MKRASITARFFAILIDMLVVMFCSVMVSAAALTGFRAGAGRLTFPDLFSILFLSLLLSSLISLFYFTYLTMEGGVTIGKRVAGIRVVTLTGEDSPRGPGFLRSLVRVLAYGLSAAFCFLGFFAAFFFKGRSLHDFIAGTRVVTEDTEEES
jgi:uncharacterized RDD family membrane protein YckC